MSRLFDPIRWNPRNPPSNPKDCILDWTNDELSWLGLRTLAIHVDGACVNNGSSTARASAGVCFGENSQYNWAGVLDSNKHPQTNQSAELFAALRALRIVKLHRVAGHKVWRKARKVIIITDSAYVVNGTTKWINGWKNNGFINSKGASVVNARKFKQLDALISELELEGVEVLFWRVDRQYNQDADRLAASVL